MTSYPASSRYQVVCDITPLNDWHGPEPLACSPLALSSQSGVRAYQCEWVREENRLASQNAQTHPLDVAWNTLQWLSKQKS